MSPEDVKILGCVMLTSYKVALDLQSCATASCILTQQLCFAIHGS